MKGYRYILEPYKGMNTRYHCPRCNSKVKTFTRYVDTEMNNQHIAPIVGRCNRESNCGYHFTPKQYFQENKPLFEPQTETKEIIRPKKIHSIIPDKYFLDSLKKYEENNFVQFLLRQFGKEITDQLTRKYFIGTAGHWKGASVFWQLDRNKKIRTGKIMLYNTITGKRVKESYSHITWVHNIIKMSEYNLVQCFFGEHLLTNDFVTPIAIVESEKTAIICSVYLPRFIWFATGGKEGLNPEKCKVLQGRKVFLYPDLNCYAAWSKKAKALSHIADFTVSDFLEQKASEAERKQGLDIADYLLLYQHKK